jgi:molybdate transport system substrate-binding protein
MTGGGGPARVLALLSAGAAKGIVAALAPAFEAEAGVAIDGTFGAVGAIRDRLVAGAPCDVVVLTAALIDELAKDGRVVPGSAAPLGSVATGIAVRAADPAPDVGDATGLRAALADAARLFFPDPQRATAGIHFARVLDRLGIRAEVAPRCATFPNGAAAMAALAQSGERGAIGCTQVTEILYTEGVRLVAPLPPPFELATVYAAAVATGARAPERAASFVARLAGAGSRELRARAGFDCPEP